MKTKEEHPKEITINTFWNLGKTSVLREALPYDHEENLYNWFKREYPDLNPSYYDIHKPERPIIPPKKL